MNSDADYSYSEPEPVQYAPSSPSLHMPVALLSCALAMFMVTQTVASRNQTTAMKAGIKKLSENGKTLADNIVKREPLVKQSGELKSKLNAMVMDLLILGKTDEDAKAIIAKHGIQQSQPSSAPDAAAGDAAPPSPK